MTNSRWEHINRDRWRRCMLKCVIDVAKFEADKWGWSVCLDDHLIEAGMTCSLERAKADAQSIAIATMDNAEAA